MADGTPGVTAEGTKTSTLSEWAGPYVTDMLARGQALSKLPYQPYKGALTAGPSALQTQAFQGIGSLTVPQNIDLAGQMATSAFGQAQQYQPQVGTVQSYMNPYLEAVLEPQRREATRAADIARQEVQGRLAQAGAYGGSRQAIMEAEGQRNLQQLLSDITGKGYSGAYDTALKQRLAEMELGQKGVGQQADIAKTLGSIGESQAQYGLANLQEMAKQGAAQREIEQQGLTADYNQYLRELAYPKEQLQFQQSLLTGLPIATTSYYEPPPSASSSAISGAQDIVGLLKSLGIITD